MKRIAESELILNADGSVFHLHIKPDHLADKIILVGDPARVANVAKYFDRVEHNASNREFHTTTGIYKNKRITVLSTGIGCDNIDIVMNELDALKNIDLQNRTENPAHKSLDIVRIGTCGGIQPENPTGTFIISRKSIGFDGLLHFYAGYTQIADKDFEKEFNRQMQWDNTICRPYVVSADNELCNRINKGEMVDGVTIACGGFYGPQGRVLRLPLSDPDQNQKIQRFRYKNWRITNFEMESSALAGLASLLGHKATTCCMVVANRNAKKADTNYKEKLDRLIHIVLERI